MHLLTLCTHTHSLSLYILILSPNACTLNNSYPSRTKCDSLSLSLKKNNWKNVKYVERGTRIQGDDSNGGGADNIKELDVVIFVGGEK